MAEGAAPPMFEAKPTRRARRRRAGVAGGHGRGGRRTGRPGSASAPRPSRSSPGSSSRSGSRLVISPEPVATRARPPRMPKWIRAETTQAGASHPRTRRPLLAAELGARRPRPRPWRPGLSPAPWPDRRRDRDRAGWPRRSARGPAPARGPGARCRPRRGMMASGWARRVGRGRDPGRSGQTPSSLDGGAGICNSMTLGPQGQEGPGGPARSTSRRSELSRGWPGFGRSEVVGPVIQDTTSRAGPPGLSGPSPAGRPTGQSLGTSSGLGRMAAFFLASASSASGPLRGGRDVGLDPLEADRVLQLAGGQEGPGGPRVVVDDLLAGRPGPPWRGRRPSGRRVEHVARDQLPGVGPGVLELEARPSSSWRRPSGTRGSGSSWPGAAPGSGHSAPASAGRSRGRGAWRRRTRSAPGPPSTVYSIRATWISWLSRPSPP